MLGFGGNKTRGTGPIGLSVSSHEVRLAQRLAGGGYALESEPLSADVDPQGPAFQTEVSRAVSTVLRRGMFVGKDLISAMPVSALRYKTLRLPPMPDEELSQAVAWEAADRLRMNDDHALQYYMAGEVSQGGERRQELILLAADKQDINDHANGMKRIGLMPSVIDATGAALARLFCKPNGTAAVIHLTDKSAEIIGTRDCKVIFDKPVDIKFNNGVLDTESLARETSLCLRYLSVTFGIHKPEMAWLCGEHNSAEVATGLGNALRLKLNTAEQVLAERQIICEPAEAGRWAVAIGLAERDEKGVAHRGAA